MILKINKKTIKKNNMIVDLLGIVKLIMKYVVEIKDYNGDWRKNSIGECF